MPHPSSRAGPITFLPGEQQLHLQVPQERARQCLVQDQGKPEPAPVPAELENPGTTIRKGFRRTGEGKTGFTSQDGLETRDKDSPQKATPLKEALEGIRPLIQKFLKFGLI